MLADSARGLVFVLTKNGSLLVHDLPVTLSSRSARINRACDPPFAVGCRVLRFW